MANGVARHGHAVAGRGGTWQWRTKSTYLAAEGGALCYLAGWGEVR